MNSGQNAAFSRRQSLKVQRRGRWSRLSLGGKLVALCLTIAVLLGAGFGVAAGALFWRLSDGPIALDSLKPTIEAFFGEQLGEGKAEIGRIWLANDSDKGLLVQLQEITIVDGQGRQVVSAPKAALGTTLLAAVTGSFNPRSVELIGPHVRIRRHFDGRVELGFASSPASASLSDGASPKSDAGEFEAAPGKGDLVAPPSGQLGGQSGEQSGALANAELPQSQPSLAVEDEGAFALGSAGAELLANISDLTVSQARLSIFDDAAGTNWESYGAELHISRPDGGLLVDVDAPFLTDRGEWRIRASVAQRRPGDVLGIDANFDAVVPSEIAARMPELAYLSEIEMPVTGKVSLAVTPQLDLRRFSVDLRFGAGFVSFPPELGIDLRPTLVDEGQIQAVYLEEDKRLDIEGIEVMLGGNRFRLSGTAEPDFAENRKLRSVRFDLRSEGLRLAADDIGRKPLEIRRALGTGRIHVAGPGLEIETLAVEFEDGGAVTVGGNVVVGQERVVSLNGRLERITIDALLQLWHRSVAPGARAWLAENMSGGVIPQGRLSVNLGPDDFALADAGLPMPNEKVQLEFGVAEVTSAYFGKMPPIEGASGSGVLEADRFRVSIKDGKVTTPAGSILDIVSGRFAIASFAEEKTVGYSTGEIDVSINGPLSGALEILDMEPLGWAKEMGVKPTETGGTAEINLDVSLPLLSAVELAQTEILAGAKLDDLQATGLFKDVAVEGGNLTIIATQREIDATGNVTLSGIQSELKWNAKIDGVGQRADTISLVGRASPESLKSFGIDLEGLVEGEMPIKLEATGMGADLTGASISADMTGATFELAQLGWSKPKGQPARLNMDIENLDNDQVRLRNIELKGEGVVLTGAIRLDPDGSLYKADISSLKLGDTADLTLNGVRGGDGVFRVKMQGNSLDSRKFIEALFSSSEAGSADEGSQDIDATYSIKSIRGRNQTDVQDASGSVRMRGGKLESLRLDGVFASGRPITLAYGRSGNRPAVVNMKTGDAGGFARLMGLYRRAYGGSMSLDARSNGNGRLEGIVSARNFAIRDEPLFRELSSAQGGRGGNDMAFSELQMRFRTNGDDIAIDNAILNGPAMGARVDGRINTEAERVSIKGTYVPAYGLNSIPAGIPLVGWVLTGRAGEGVVGMTFQVEGSMSNPRVQINPLSAIAPGILRSLFEFRGR